MRQKLNRTAYKFFIYYLEIILLSEKPIVLYHFGIMAGRFCHG